MTGVILCALALIIAPRVTAEEAGVWLGARSHLSLAVGSGAGYWDWTSPTEAGRLRSGFGAGAGIEARIPLSPAIELGTGILASGATVGQDVDGRVVEYLEGIISVPLVAHASTRTALGTIGVMLGPAVTVVPVPARRTAHPADASAPAIVATTYPAMQVQASMEAGLEWSVLTPRAHRVIIGLRFIHPLTSPRYPWVPSSAGNIRINRFDLTVSVLGAVGGAPAPPPAAATPSVGAPPPARSVRSVRLGLEANLGTAIGTGKAHWDWYGGGSVQRMPLVSGSVGARVVAPLGPSLNGAASLRYSLNPTRITTSVSTADYRHDALEAALTAELVIPWADVIGRRTPANNFVVWGGPALVVLVGDAEVEPAGAFALSGTAPGQRFNLGADLGLALDRGNYRLQFRYVTLYTSPGYPRAAGAPPSDLRWHRFEVGVVWFVGAR